MGLETETAKEKQERRLWKVIRIREDKGESTLLGIGVTIYLQSELKGDPNLERGKK